MSKIKIFKASALQYIKMDIEYVYSICNIYETYNKMKLCSVFFCLRLVKQSRKQLFFFLV